MYGAAALKVKSGKTLNERVVTWHLFEDVLGWVAVLIVSIVLMFWDILVLDPILSILITLYVLWNVLKRLKETMMIFLQGAPEDININNIESEILSFDRVKSIHHTHIWSLDGEHNVLTTHLVLEYIKDIDEILKVKDKVKQHLKKYNLSH